MEIFPSVSDLLDLRAVNATWHLGPCAEVRVGEHVTRYVRRGSGPSIVLLGADAEANPVWGPLAESLAGGHRLVIPQPPPEGVDSSTWLRGFIEGIGLSSFALIAGSTLSDAALDLAAVDDSTVRKLVLIANAGSPIGYSGLRTLWVPPDWVPANAAKRIEAFLELTTDDQRPMTNH